MQGLSRRDASKLIALGLLSPLYLSADENVDIENPSANYELTRYKDGSLEVASKKDELRFRIGKNAFLLRQNSKISVKTSGLLVKSMKLISGGAMGVFAPGEKNIETKTFTAGIRGTGIYLEEKNDNAIYCCLCYGVGDFVGKDKNQIMHLNSIHHDKPVVIEASHAGSVKMFDDKTHNHDDDELRVLEAMCGREPPFEEWLKMQQFLNPKSVY